MNTAPHITVVIPTCDRSQDIARCLISLREVSYPHWDVIVVDQGSGTETKDIVDTHARISPILRYAYLPRKNASLARNHGFELARGEIVAFLDDDCTVEPEWLQQVAAVFARHPQATMVFGTVRAVEHDVQTCIIPAYDAHKEQAIERRWAFDGEMGASMYLRRVLVECPALFDPCLGPGALPFSSCQDWELAYRIQRSGGIVFKTPAIVVDHYGYRDYRSGAANRLIRSCAFSAGGVTMKMLRCGDPAALLLLVVQAQRLLTMLQPRNLILLRRPTGLVGIVSFLRGLVTSFQLGIDHQRCIYVTRVQPSESST